jgi:hypothetical protein
MGFFLVLAQAVNFFSFDSYRRAFEKALGHEPGNRAKICAGALAGAMLATTPTTIHATEGSSLSVPMQHEHVVCQMAGLQAMH